MRNPFTPTFGMVPPYLAGRGELLDMMGKAFGNWPGDPNLISILVGPRGVGKTALLSCIGDKAKEEGWIVVDTAAVKGMLEDILQQAALAADHLTSPASKRKVTGLSVGQLFGVEWTLEEEKLNWRARMALIMKKLEPYNTGLVITVDEVLPSDEMIELVSAYQLLIREGVKISLIMAGLPANTDRLLSHESVSFLRRARVHRLGRVRDTEIERAFSKTLSSSGKTIAESSLEKAVKAAFGFPYMMQLVGFAMWENSGQRDEISLQDVEAGINQARKDLEHGVLDSTMRELSRGDCRFLAAMLPDREYSRLSDIGKRMKKSSGYISTYKNRMLLAGIIEEQPGNTLEFSLPFFREYFAEHYHET